MAATPHDWEVVIDCPGCGQRGRVTVRLLKTMVRCPACRTRFVVGRNGARKASREMILAGQAEVLAAQASTRAARTPAVAIQPQRTSPRLPLYRRYMLALVLPALLVPLLMFALRGPLERRRASTGPGDLSRQATQFADALIANNLDDAAQAAGIEPRELTTWWRVRRAAMMAGQGDRVRGELRAVDVEEQGGSAVVRLTFVVGGNVHVFTQCWEQSTVAWQLQVTPADAAAGRGLH